ncbi:Metallo-dependent hydrolase, partial [Leucogyrophana mollusca]
MGPSAKLEFDDSVMGGPESLTLIRRVHLAHSDPSEAERLWNVECSNGRVHTIYLDNGESSGDLSDTLSGLPVQVVDGEGGVLLPSLCHAHIHLDKCFILGQCEPLITGSLAEALQVTNQAKATFPDHPNDLYARATRLVRESVEAGVTSMRAYVEIDTAVDFLCLDVGLTVSREWSEACDVQIVAFAQEALFSHSNAQKPGRNYELLVEAIGRPGVSVVGSAPWVEPSPALAKENITRILALAKENNLHADFHLDYNVDPQIEPMVWYVLDQMRALSWTKATGKRVTLGHATRLGLFTTEEWAKLKLAMEELPLEVVGLPQSDMYMMGRASATGAIPLGGRTLNAPQIWRRHGVHVALSVNNVENAFTPQGSLDPLSLASLGVGVFQVGTENDWRELLRAVTISSKRAIGLGGDNDFRCESEAQDGGNELVPRVGDPADFFVVHEARRWQSTVLNPGFDRTTLYRGKVVARRRADRWN